MQFINKLLKQSEERAWKKYLFEDHSEQFLMYWASQLKYFRFVRARNDHGGTPDEILLLLRYNGQEDLIKLFDSLEIKFQQFSEEPPQPEPHKTYSGQEFSKFPSLIPGTKWIEQPLHQVINGKFWIINGYKDRVKFIVVGPPEKHWQITKTEFENAKQFETLFENHVHRIIDPPEDSKHCICPKYYPQYWAAG